MSSAAAPTTFCFEAIKRAAPRPAKPAQRPLPYTKYTSPYHEFSRTQRPLLPTNMKGTDREKAIGQMWRELSEAERAAFKQGLKPEPSSGRGGLRVWAPVPPALTTTLPTPPSVAVTVIALAPGCAPAVSVAASVAVTVVAAVPPVAIAAEVIAEVVAVEVIAEEVITEDTPAQTASSAHAWTQATPELVQAPELDPGQAAGQAWVQQKVSYPHPNTHPNYTLTLTSDPSTNL